MEEVRPGAGPRFTLFLAIVTLIAVGGALWLVFNPAVRRQRALQDEIRRYDTELAQLEQRRAQLQSRYDTLLYNGEALEKEVRRQLGYVRPGEVALIPTAPFDISTRFDASKIAPLERAPWITVGLCTVLGLLALSFAALAVGCVLESRPRAESG